MGGNQSEEIKMFRVVQAAIEAHKTLIPVGTPLLAGYGTFAALLGYLDKVPEGDRATKEDAGLDKRQLRADAIGACLRFAAVLRSYGNATGNEDMQADGRVSRAKLEAAPDNAFAAAALNILSWIDRLSSSVLSDYSVAPSEVRGAYGLLNSLSKCNDGERAANAHKAVAIGDGPRIVAALIEILETMMDPAVESMAIAQPHFYREYFAARI
jgi:hypothetical protein